MKNLIYTILVILGAGVVAEYGVDLYITLGLAR